MSMRDKHGFDKTELIKGPFKDQIDTPKSDPAVSPNGSPLAVHTGRGKKLNIWIAIFAILLIGVIVYGIIQVVNQTKLEPGWYMITAQEDKTVPSYASGTQLLYMFTGSSRQTRKQYDGLMSDYSAALKSVYSQLDAHAVCSFCTNIASINQNPGKPITVSPELYRTLQDADRLTREQRGFNLYAGALYEEWNGVLYSEEKVMFDPLGDPIEAERLSRLAAATSDLSNFDLKFSQTDVYTVTLTVSDEYVALLRELECPNAPTLDLNLLQDAYKLQMVAEILEAKGYQNGCLTSDSGVSVTFPNYNAQWTLEGLQDGKIAAAAEYQIPPSACAVRLRAFSLGGENDPYYAIQADGKQYFRHPNLASDGVFRENLTAAVVCSETRSAPETALDCLSLFAQDSPDGVKETARGLGQSSAAFLLRDDPTTLWTTDGTIAAVEENGYHAEQIP